MNEARVLRAVGGDVNQFGGAGHGESQQVANVPKARTATAERRTTPDRAIAVAVACARKGQIGR